MSTTPPTPVESNLIPIGKGLYLSKPVLDAATATPAESQPTVILIFGWMGARLSHLLKYTKVYDELYPAATKIVIRSEPSFFWTSEKGKRANLAPVVDVLEALGCLEGPQKSKHTDGQPIEPSSIKPPPRVLAHAFSNGGAWQLSTLSAILTERLSNTSFMYTPAPPSAVILDSCPGEGDVKRTQKAFLTAVRHPVLRVLASAAITAMIYFARFTQWLFRVEAPLTIMRKNLLKANLLPWFSKATPRLYIYSKADDLILYRDVEAHAAEAEGKSGLEVRLERFDDSPHVAHARADPERYWGAIQKLWTDVSTRG